MDVPAFCNDCGSVFRSGLTVESPASDVPADQPECRCPACGGSGHIPDGILDFVENTIAIFSGQQRSVDELSRLAQVLYQARMTTQSPEEVVDTIRGTVPEFSGMADLLPQSPADLPGFIALTASVIAFSLQGAQDESARAPLTVAQTIDRVFRETTSALGIKRNDLCPCGSGKRYKRCCGKI